MRLKIALRPHGRTLIAVTNMADATTKSQSGCGVEAEALQPVTREMVAALKLGEEHKQKSYVATCRLSAPPDPALLAALNASTDILVRTWRAYIYAPGA